MTPSERTSHEETILIVDDDRNIRLATREILRRGGYEDVLSASTSAAALELLEEKGGAISVVILDVRMPDMDGMAVMEHLVKVHAFPLGVIMITAFGIKEKAAFYELGSDIVFPAGYVEKPFDHALLLSEVTKAMEQARTKRSEQIDTP